jgi:integrase
MGTYRVSGGYRYHFERGGRRFSGRGFPTRKAALEAERQRRADLDRGLIEPYRTVRELADAWLISGARTKSARWCYQLRVKLDRGFERLMPLRPRDVTVAHVDRCLSDLAGDDRGARSCNEYRKILVALLNYAVRVGVLDRNVARLTARQPEDPAAVNPIDRAHLARLILAADPRLRALLVVQSQTGARFCELARLRAGEVVLDGPHPFCVLTTHKTTGGHARQRLQPLNGLAASTIAEQIRLTRCRLVFDWAGEAGLHYHTELRRLHRLCDRLGVPRYSFHQLRHWAGYVATAGGGSKKAVARFLGHSDTGATERYMHAVDAELWAVAERLQDA